MIELPKLSERIVRLHALRWNDLIKAHGFTGDHLTWHESRDRRRKAAKPINPDILLPPPSESLGTVKYYGANGEPVSFEEWRKKQLAAWAAREGDPAVIDSIGIAETVHLAKARLAGIVGDYLAAWADTNGDSDEFMQWLEGIRHLVGFEVGDLWRHGEWQAAWFERACRKEVYDQLEASVEEWKSRASGLEIQHLENPHLSLQSLLASAGDLNFAVTLEQGEQTIRLLASVETLESTGIGDRKTPTEGLEQGVTQQGTRTAATRDGGVLPNPGTLVNRSGVGTMNITPQQKDLLFAIVDGYHSSGSEFMFLQTHSSRPGGGGLCFGSQPPIPISAGDLDFRQLKREDLITLEEIPGSGLRGKPTQLGIETAAFLRGQEAPSSKAGPANDITILTLRKPDGTRAEDIAAHISSKAILVMDAGHTIDAGDMLIRSLPSGLRVGFIVRDPGYREGLGSIPAHFEVKAQRAAPIDSLQPSAFWRERRAEFEQLAGKQREVLGSDREDRKWLTGCCSHIYDEGGLGNCEVLGGADSELRSKFEDVATQCAMALGSPPESNSVNYWAYCLFLDLLQNKPLGFKTELLECLEDGGIIVDLLASSAAYCSRLAAIIERQANLARVKKDVKPPPWADSESGPVATPDAAPLVVATDTPHSGKSEGESRRHEAPEASSEPPPASGLKPGTSRGRRPDIERRDAIRCTIAKHGPAWRDHLSDIFQELDKNTVRLGRFAEIEIALDDQTIKASKWEELEFAEGGQRTQIIDALRKYV